MNFEYAKKLFDYLVSSIKIYEKNEAASIIYLTMEHFGIKKTDIFLDKKIPAIDLKKLEMIIQRLNNSEPIQYVLGETEFYGRKFKVNPHVLIPRPETEELVDKIIKENQESKKLKILDIGTGSGCIAVTLAKELPDSEVHAIDISQEALEVAKENAKENNVEVNFIHQDITTYNPQLSTYDLIVSNPPYITEDEKVFMNKNVLNHEPHHALFVRNNNPLFFYEKIIAFATKCLKKNGKCYFEINEKYGAEIASVLSENNLHNIELKKDIHGKDRFISFLN